MASSSDDDELDRQVIVNKSDPQAVANESDPQPIAKKHIEVFGVEIVTFHLARRLFLGNVQ
jgi:hypothetical protein